MCLLYLPIDISISIMIHVHVNWVCTCNPSLPKINTESEVLEY